jgi:hypothetical protein
LDTEGWIKIGFPVSRVVFKLLLEPVKPNYAAGILFSATFSIKNGVSNWAKFPNSVYPKSRLYCTLTELFFLVNNLSVWAPLGTVFHPIST